MGMLAPIGGSDTGGGVPKFGGLLLVGIVETGVLGSAEGDGDPVLIAGSGVPGRAFGDPSCGIDLLSRSSWCIDVPGTE